MTVRLGLSTLGLLGEEDGLDVGEDPALGDRHPGQQIVQLLVVPQRQLEVPRDDPGLLVVPGSVAGQLKDLGSEAVVDERQKSQIEKRKRNLKTISPILRGEREI